MSLNRLARSSATTGLAVLLGSVLVRDRENEGAGLGGYVLSA
jgi:hypothetical protein